MIDKETVEENQSLTSPTIYEIIANEGREELKRPFSSLLFSDIAAGLCLSFSLFVSGYLAMMTDNSLIIALGYCAGFLMVIKGRLQLFTENTITPILPLLKYFNKRSLYRTGRLWLIVFIANMIGTFLAVCLMHFFNMASDAQIAAFIEIAKHSVGYNHLEIFLLAVPAGFILATMVWMLPSAQTSKVLVIIIMTYIISIGGFTHVVAGSSKIFLLYFNDLINLSYVFEYIVLAALGNVVGGSVLFSLLAYGQTYKEL